MKKQKKNWKRVQLLISKAVPAVMAIASFAVLALPSAWPLHHGLPELPDHLKEQIQ